MRVHLFSDALEHGSLAPSGITTFMARCGGCEKNLLVSYDANTELAGEILCPNCHLNLNAVRCRREGCAQLRSGDTAIVVRIGRVKHGHQLIDTEYSRFGGQKYYCSSACLVADMTERVNFLPEAEYRQQHTPCFGYNAEDEGGGWYPRPE